MKFHPRHKVTQAANMHFGLALAKITHEYELTQIETAQMLTYHLTSELKYMLRKERHGDLTIPADQAEE